MSALERPRGAMRVEHDGLLIQLAPDDPRIERIRALLWGEPEPEAPAPAPVPETPQPEPEVPAVFRLLWERLSDMQRRELVLLADGPIAVEALEQAMGFTHQRLRAQHSSIGRRARHLRTSTPIRHKGRKREQRRFFLEPRAAGWVRTLARGTGPS